MSPFVNRRADDEGVGMVLVLATVGIITTLMLVATMTATRSLTSSRKHVSFESALSAAETGLDTVLAIMEVFQRDLGDAKYRPAPLLREMVDAGYLGRKTRRGFYRY